MSINQLEEQNRTDSSSINNNNNSNMKSIAGNKIYQHFQQKAKLNLIRKTKEKSQNNRNLISGKSLNK
jgi:hypothetical protein